MCLSVSVCVCARVCVCVCVFTELMDWWVFPSECVRPCVSVACWVAGCLWLAGWLAGWLSLSCV